MLSRHGSGILAAPHIIDRLTARSCECFYEAPGRDGIGSTALSLARRGCAACSLPGAPPTLSRRDFPIP